MVTAEAVQALGTLVFTSRGGGKAGTELMACAHNFLHETELRLAGTTTTP